jgi:uncharacterized membrane protein YdjX (TVP38/TMEM64 family)
MELHVGASPTGLEQRCAVAHQLGSAAMTVPVFVVLLLAVFAVMVLVGLPGAGLVVLAGLVWWTWNWGTP